MARAVHPGVHHRRRVALAPGYVLAAEAGDAGGLGPVPGGAPVGVGVVEEAPYCHVLAERRGQGGERGFARTGPHPAWARSWFTRARTAASSEEWPSPVAGTGTTGLGAAGLGAAGLGAAGLGAAGLGAAVVFTGSGALVDGEGVGEGEAETEGDGEADGVGEALLASAEGTARPGSPVRPPCCWRELPASGVGEALASVLEAESVPT